MFKKFDEKDNVSGTTLLKSSVRKGIRAKLLDSYPGIEAYLEDLLPKKENSSIVKCHDHIELLVNAQGELLFFRHYDGPWCPTLKVGFHTDKFAIENLLDLQISTQSLDIRLLFRMHRQTFRQLMLFFRNLITIANFLSSPYSVSSSTNSHSCFLMSAWTKVPLSLCSRAPTSCARA